MNEHHRPATKNQKLFIEIIYGTLIYAVVLGFFSDYTDILYTRSYSTTFMVAFVMQILTYVIFGLKKRIASWAKSREVPYKPAFVVLSVWPIAFASKFVFLWVIDFIFDDYVVISGVFGLIAIIVTMLVTKALIDTAYTKLGSAD